MSINVLLTMEDRGYDYSVILDYLKNKGYSADWKPLNGMNSDEIVKAAKGYDAIMAGVEKWTGPVMQELSDTLKIIARYGIGYDSVDLNAATRLGIAVTNTPGTMSGSVAEMALALMLNMTRRICEFDKRLKNGEWWQYYMGSQLENRTVGILGFGKIGQKLAQYLQGFKCNLIAYDVAFNEEAAKTYGVEYVSLEQLIRESDYISLHLPLTPSTRDIVDYDFLCNMKPTAYLINTGRGGLVNENALISALREDIIAGAALDVYKNEPLEKDSPLIKAKNILLTPHVSSSTLEGCREAGLRAADNIIDLFEGRQPRNLLNKEISNILVKTVI